jgi:carbonic anhydrase
MHTVSADQALEKLKQGNQRNTTGRVEAAGRDAARRRELVSGQRPFAVILGCADSRIVPEIIFDTGIGDLFVIRVAGNIADAATIASIEYAVAHLGTRLVVVLAHESCGAVTAAINEASPDGHLTQLFSLISPAIDPSAAVDVDQTARRNARLTAKRLTDKSDIISESVRNDGVKVIPAFYRLETGQVDFEPGTL